MAHTLPVNRSYHLLIVLLAGIAAAGCGKKIGDSCNTNIDCDRYGSRICDLSQPGGYCTEDGCDENSCPSEAICVRFFDQKFATTSCDDQPCKANEMCVAREAGTTPPYRVCAPASSERRY